MVAFGISCRDHKNPRYLLAAPVLHVVADAGDMLMHMGVQQVKIAAQ